MAAPALLGWWLLRDHAASGSDQPAASYSRLLAESLRGAQALLAFLALSNLDAVVARHALTDEGSGLYAAGLVLSKAVLFLPQFILVRVFPALSTKASRARALAASVGVIVVLGLGVAAVAAAFPQLALVFVGGGDFVAIQDILWVFAVLGSVQALVQLFIYSVLASAATGPTLATWVALLIMLPAGLRMDTVEEMVLLVISLNVALLLVLVAMTRGSWARR
jgi:O-antigen/teichoic acid export membrane protein